MDSYGIEADDSDRDSVIHQDSDEDDNVEHDDDVDIGFRRHQYETFDDDRPKRPRSKDEAIYGVFMEDDDYPRKRGRMDASKPAPMFVSATNEEPMFVAAKKQDDPASAPAPSMFVAAKTQESANSMFVSAKIEDTPSEQDARQKSKTESQTNDFLPASQTGEEATGADDATDEDKEVEQKQKEADQYFVSLLNKARTKKRRPLDAHDEMSSLAAIGSGVPSSFGDQRHQDTPAPPLGQKDPSLAKWEKHTKGIGSKLLAKMGWSGKGGLGSNRRKLKTDKPAEDQELPKPKKGISRPVEVVVRPNNMGLGFGNFKEATQLKVNRQIEAEVRGVEIPGKDKKKSKDLDEFQPKTTSSAIPSTGELLSQKNWKKIRKQKSPKARIIPYEQLLENQKLDGQAVIIDMRGPAKEDSKQVANDGKVPLGEELLHNVSFLLNTYENKLHSSANFARSLKQKTISLESDIEDMRQRKKNANDRISKIEKTIHVVNQVDEITALMRENKTSGANSANYMSKVQALIQELKESFTEEERESLKFWEIIAPSLLSPVTSLQLERWDPLGDFSRSKVVIDSIFNLDLKVSKTDDDVRSLMTLRESMIENQLFPRIKQVLGSPRWNPVLDTEVALQLYEFLEQKIQTSVDENTPVQEDDGANVFPADDLTNKKHERISQILRKEIILDTIHPKIQTALNEWKPVLTKQSGKSLQLENRLDLWILPWLPHLDHPALIPQLLSDCKRKLKSGVSYIQKHTSTDMEFLRGGAELLKPWRLAFPKAELQRLVSDKITARLARSLAKEKICSASESQSWTSFDFAFEMHGLALLSDIEFISIIEGECLMNLASTIHSLLLDETNVLAIGQLYKAWKMRILLGHDVNESLLAEKSLRLLQTDQGICGIFYSIVKMLQLASSTEGDFLEQTNPPSSNFRVVLARRMKEKKHELEDDFVRMEARSAAEIDARLRLRRRNLATATFREVVEEFANDRGILFRPKMGANSRFDGKQIFLCGEAMVYLDGDVVFAGSGSEWRPVSLDQLGEIAK